MHDESRKDAAITKLREALAELHIAGMGELLPGAGTLLDELASRGIHAFWRIQTNPLHVEFVARAPNGGETVLFNYSARQAH